MIYYFSGTGNSLYVAKKVAKALGLSFASMTSYIDQPIEEKSKDIILIYPMYNHSYPLIVKSFLEAFCQMNTLADYKVTVIETYGNAVGISLRNVGSLLDALGGHLQAGFGVQMAYNYVEPSAFKLKGLLDSFVIRTYTEEALNDLFITVDEKVESVIKSIEANQSIVESSDVVIESIVDKLGLRDSFQKKAWARVAGIQADKKWDFFQMVKHMDQGFWTNESCNGCGTCVQICPVKNVNLVDKRPHFLHNCEQCFACLSWCPKGAIEFRQSTIHKNRYQNPRIKLSEMLRKDV